VPRRGGIQEGVPPADQTTHRRPESAMSPESAGRPDRTPAQLTIRERIRRAAAEEAQERHHRQVVAIARLIRRAATLQEEDAAREDQN
jgi:hypothetical protein